MFIFLFYHDPYTILNHAFLNNVLSAQTIKNDDLEEIRKLGTGAYGAVYHGKWRGADIAIKRIKASCFSGTPSERERLVYIFSFCSKLHIIYTYLPKIYGADSIKNAETSFNFFVCILSSN